MKKYKYESRHKHATNRIRDSKGRFIPSNRLIHRVFQSIKPSKCWYFWLKNRGQVTRVLRITGERKEGKGKQLRHRIEYSKDRVPNETREFNCCVSWTRFSIIYFCFTTATNWVTAIAPSNAPFSWRNKLWLPQLHLPSPLIRRPSHQMRTFTSFILFFPFWFSSPSFWHFSSINLPSPSFCNRSFYFLYYLLFPIYSKDILEFHFSFSLEKTKYIK